MPWCLFVNCAIGTIKDFHFLVPEAEFERAGREFLRDYHPRTSALACQTHESNGECVLHFKVACFPGLL